MMYDNMKNEVNTNEKMEYVRWKVHSPFTLLLEFVLNLEVYQQLIVIHGLVILK